MVDVKAKQFMEKVINRNSGEPEFHQAVQEVVESLMPYIEKNKNIKMLRF